MAFIVLEGIIQSARLLCASKFCTDFEISSIIIKVNLCIGMLLHVFEKFPEMIGLGQKTDLNSSV